MHTPGHPRPTPRPGPRLLQPHELFAQPLLIDVFAAGLRQAAGHELGIIVENGADVPLGLLPRFPRGDALFDIQLSTGASSSISRKAVEASVPMPTLKPCDTEAP